MGFESLRRALFDFFLGLSAVSIRQSARLSGPRPLLWRNSNSVSPQVKIIVMRSVRTLATTTLVLLMACTVPAAEKTLDQFARCLASKQVSMYGAYWCPHCAEQKEKFGTSFKYVPYVECSIPGQSPQVQTQACKEMQIKKYPTWVFPDGERVEAIQTMEQLSQRSGCKLP
jgi:hypothetical protein